MNIAIICSNYFSIRRATANGTAIFAHSFIEQLAKRAQGGDISVTAFASGDSEVPVPLESIDAQPSSADEDLIVSGKNILYEQTLLAKAFSMQEKFDIYHVHIGDGDIALPFARFVDRPILITIHHILSTDYMRKYFSFYKEARNIHFISASNAQRTLLPDLNYLKTIYHGVDPDAFAFDMHGGDRMMWAGRLIPEKGPDVVAEIARATGRGAKLFGIPRKQHEGWLREKVIERLSTDSSTDDATRITLETGRDRYELAEQYRSSKLFLFPISYEESFGFVLIESMSCGTPVVAYARGSIPEIIEDGKTGFIVNPSDTDIAGEWIIKKTGPAGLQEAVERMYAMSPEEYGQMRQACRERVMRHFTIERMVDEYLKAYQAALGA